MKRNHFSKSKNSIHLQNINPLKKSCLRIPINTNITGIFGLRKLKIYKEETFWEVESLVSVLTDIFIYV